MPVPVVGVGEHEVGAVHLVAGGTEIVRDRAEVGAAGDAVLHEPGGLGLVGVGTGAGVDAELGLELALDGSGVDEAGQALGEGWFLRPGCQPDRQPPGGDMVHRAAGARELQRLPR